MICTETRASGPVRRIKLIRILLMTGETGQKPPGVRLFAGDRFLIVRRGVEAVSGLAITNGNVFLTSGSVWSAKQIDKDKILFGPTHRKSIVEKQSSGVGRGSNGGF